MVFYRFSRVFTVLVLFFFYSGDYSFADQVRKKDDFRDQLLAQFPNPPSFDSPCSQLCTFDQFQSDQYSFWSNEMHLKPLFHRKYWEWCYILQVLARNGKLGNGYRGLGFGVGKEPLPSILAKYGCSVVATDQSEDLARKSGWSASSEHPHQLQELYYENLCSKEDFFSRVSFEEVDMNDVPESLQNFDFTWSSCSLEHLGSLEKGIEFILNSLKCLKSGGIAVHTTEFNLSSNTSTVSSGLTVIYRESDLKYMIQKISEQGHTIIPLNLNPGLAPLDMYVDFPPYSPYGHLKLALLDYISTSVGVIIIKN